ncbi:hypothetical protein [Sphingomonas crusticola]|uniref:hypothetical protein n=1 Tax=Sphingomonas crusticola TaxID=1697973 RepID=UPI000E23BA42|nr:hypothetical protein [Sphingomonas crusticola]
MADEQTPLDETGTLTEEERAAIEAKDFAKREQFGQSGDRVDQTMGHMGGAGAAGSGPDISKQSQPVDVSGQ